MELIVAITLSAIITALVTNSLILQSDYYMEEIARTRIQQNLRGALDIIAMNVRQAGENLDENFPSLLLSDGTSDTLTIRRNLLPEVIVVCKAIAIGDDQIFVSDDESKDSECIPGNVAPSLAVWSAYRVSEGGSVPIYIYDRVGRTGRFVEYVDEGVSDGDDYLEVEDPFDEAYPDTSSSLFMLEQFVFELDAADNTLELYVNGDDATAEDVAYDISGFTVEIEMQDATVVTALGTSGTYGWKDIRAVKTTLTGIDSWKNRTFTRSVTGEYFPRNVLSE